MIACSAVLLFVILGFSLASAETDQTERVLRGATNDDRRLGCTSPRLLLQSGDSLHVGYERFSWDADRYASIKQEDNGNLVIKRTSDGEVLCESGMNLSSNDVPYYTKLIGDGNLITWYTPERVAPIVWKSNAVGPTTSSYYLSVNCDDSVSIYYDSFSGPALWTCPGSGRQTPPSPPPSPQPTSRQEPLPTSTPPITTFCVVGDAPYRYEESLKLLEQVDHMDSECEFVAHLGDIRSARMFDTCVRETYTNASLIMKRSRKPVLMMLGGKPPHNMQHSD